MAKTAVHQIRIEEADKLAWRKTAAAGGWVSVGDMIRDLISQEQLRQPQPQIAQSLPAHQPDAPPL